MDERENNSGTVDQSTQLNDAVGNADAGDNGKAFVFDLYDTNGNYTGYAVVIDRESGNSEIQYLYKDSRSVSSEIDGSESVENGAETVEADAEVIDGMHFLATGQIVLIVGVFLCFGALAVRTLVKAFEK